MEAQVALKIGLMIGHIKIKLKKINSQQNDNAGNIIHQHQTKIQVPN